MAAPAMAAPPSPGDGVALIERTLVEISQEVDRRVARPADWDSSLADISATVRTRIPPLVEERCSSAQHRANCGLIGEVRYAWASADDTLYLWDYHSESPQVLIFPADSAIVSVAVCPPRPGVFDAGSVHLLVVVCTRLTASLIGVQVPQRGSGLAARALPVAPAAAAAAAPAAAGGLFGGAGLAPPTAGGTGVGLLPPGGGGAASMGQQPPRAAAGRAAGVRLVPLEGYTARTDGAIFHSISHTADGHIFMSCGAPQLYELVYSRAAGMFHSKCRLIRHVMSFWSRVRDFLSVSSVTCGRIRVVECAPRDYAVAIDDFNNLRLFGIRDQAVHSSESIAIVEELAAIGIAEISSQHHALTRQHLGARSLAHAFPVIGLDGHLRVRAVTGAGDRLLFVCSADSPTGPPPPVAGPVAAAAAPGGAAPPAAARPQGGGAQRRYHGFWLRSGSEGRLGGGGAMQWQGTAGAFALPPNAAPSGAPGGGALCARRSSCLEESREPCLYAGGVWLASTVRPNTLGTELSVSAEVEDAAGMSGGGALNMFTSVGLDSPVFDIVEEGASTTGIRFDSSVGDGGLPAPLRRDGGCLGSSGEIADGASSAFRTSRSFAVLLRGSVQVFRLTLKSHSLNRAPATALECCAQFAQLALPPAASPSATPGAPPSGRATPWAWSFDDVGVPSWEAQRRQMEADHTVPSLRLGRWFCGLLRFLAVVLRSVWEQPLVAPLRGRQFVSYRGRDGSGGLGLAISEEVVRQLLARLRPALRFARQQGLGGTGKGGASPAPVKVPATMAERFLMYTTQVTVENEGLAQVQRLLSSVLDVAERAQQVIGLLGVLHSQRSAYRVLQSSVLTGEAIEALLTKPLGELVATTESVAPVVQLCAAVVMESGLTTPGAEFSMFEGGGQLRRSGSSGAGRRRGPLLGGVAGDGRLAGNEVCRELEEQCPGILAQVDLAQLQTRIATLGAAAASQAFADAGAAPPGQSREVLRRYAACVSASSTGDHWVELGRSIHRTALEDPQAAVDIVVEKLEELARGPRVESAAEAEAGSAATTRAKFLLDALLGAVAGDLRGAPRSAAAAGAAAGAHLEKLLRRTQSLRLPGEDAAALPFVQGVILDHLLQTPHERRTLEALLDKAIVDVSFLRSRSETSRLAGDLLWKHFLRHDQPLDASRVLEQLADRPDRDYGLEQRVHYVDLARQAAASARRLPASRAIVERLSNKLDIAVRVQLPLMHELQLVASDERVSSRWRSAARERRQELQELAGLQELYQVASDFSMYQIVLVVADMSPSVQDREVTAFAWVSLLFPPAASPFAPAELDRSLEAPAYPRGLFPLLLVRPEVPFFAREASGSSASSAAPPSRDELQVRTTRFIAELSGALQESSSIWDVRCVATLLEYCNCMWMHCFDTLEAPRGGGPAEGAGPGLGRGWVALAVMRQRPFEFGMADLVKLYTGMLESVPSWVRELQGMIPADPTRNRPMLVEDDVCLHLVQVMLLVVARWVADADASRLDERVAEEFAESWPASERMLALARARLSDLEGGRRRGELTAELVAEARSLDAKGRRLASQRPGPAAAAPPPPARWGTPGRARPERPPSPPPPLPRMPDPAQCLPELG